MRELIGFEDEKRGMRKKNRRKGQKMRRMGEKNEDY